MYIFFSKNHENKYFWQKILDDTNKNNHDFVRAASINLQSIFLCTNTWLKRFFSIPNSVVFASKRPGLKDFCLLFEMEGWWTSEAHKIKIVVNEIFELYEMNIIFLQTL